MKFITGRKRVKKQLPIDKQKSQSFSLLHLNIRSISNKFDCFKQFLDALDIHFQIIGLTETWLNDINHDSFNLNGYKYTGCIKKKETFRNQAYC
jgi:hypothetical protein